MVRERKILLVMAKWHINLLFQNNFKKSLCIIWRSVQLFLPDLNVKSFILPLRHILLNLLFLENLHASCSSQVQRQVYFMPPYHPPTRKNQLFSLCVLIVFIFLRSPCQWIFFVNLSTNYFVIKEKILIVPHMLLLLLSHFSRVRLCATP